jgi:hypothetical protein
LSASQGLKHIAFELKAAGSMMPRERGGNVVALGLQRDASMDVAEFVFGLDDPMPITELAGSFLAIDRLFVSRAPEGVRLALTEIRQGSIVALLAPYVPMLGQAMTMADSAVTVGDFVKRTRDALNAFAGIDRPEPTRDGPDSEIASDLAELIKPLVGKPGAKFGVAHIKYRRETKERTVEVEASYGAAEIDQVARNTEQAVERSEAPLTDQSDVDDGPALIRRAVLNLQQANVGPAKERGQTGDRGIVKDVAGRPLPVYFAKTINDLKRKMVGRSSNPFKGSFVVDVLVNKELGVPKSYTVIEVHGPHKSAVKSSVKGQLNLTGGG